MYQIKIELRDVSDNKISYYSSRIEAKEQFMLLIDNYSSPGQCYAWDDEIQDENLYCGVCSMCSIISENENSSLEVPDLLFINDYANIILQEVSHTNTP